MARSRLVVGAHVVCYVNNRMFGRVADIEWDSATPRKESRCVDTLKPAELMPEAVSVNGQMTIYRLHNDGGIEAAGMVATWADLPREKYFSLLILDRVTDTVIFRADECSVEHQSWKAQKGYVMGRIRFKGLDWSNETAPSTA